MTTTSMLRRVLYWTGGVLATATVLTVALHLAPVREALGWKPLGVADATGGTSSGWCPFGFGSTDASAKVAITHAPHDPTHPRAHARPALGFTLDATTKADVTAWATAHQIACKATQGGATLECSDVPAALLPSGENKLALETAWFFFAGGARLESVQTIRRGADPTTVVAAFDDAQAAVTARAGAPAVRDGVTDAADLARGALRQARVEYRFQDYHALMRATNMGAAKGYLLTETYAAVLD